MNKTTEGPGVDPERYDHGSPAHHEPSGMVSQSGPAVGWSKSVLISGIVNSIHLEIILENEQEMCDNIQKVEDDAAVSSSCETIPYFVWLFMMRQHLSNSMRRKPQWPITKILKPAVSCVIYL